jgi:hypothetical protein
MSFTAQELRLLQLSDAIDSHSGAGGRPRTRPDTPAQERRRFRAKAIACNVEIDLQKGGRPRKPYVDEKTERRREQHRQSYLKRRERMQAEQQQTNQTTEQSQ